MMTVDINIDQYGEGVNIYPIFRLEIGNLGTVRSLGFGNDFCKYVVRKLKYNGPTMQKYGSDEWELEKEVIIPEHNRRDGAIELVRKACELLEGVDTEETH